MESKLTVYFDPPFWVGLVERQDEDGVRAARVVFGSEPGDAELLEFLLARYRTLRFGPPVQAEDAHPAAPNFKRSQREVRRLLQARQPGTRAQIALKKAREESGAKRQENAKAERQQEQARRFEERCRKKKEKHRGH